MEEVYKCSFCGKMFEGYEECWAHELKEAGVNNRIYFTYKRFSHEAEIAFSSVKNNPNEETRANLDEAIDKLIEFEKEYNIDKQKIRKVGLSEWYNQNI